MKEYICTESRTSGHRFGGRGKRALRTMLVVSCAALVILGTVAPALAVSAGAPRSANETVSAPTVLSTHSTALGTVSSRKSISTDGRSAANSATTNRTVVANVTLVTGQTVRVVEGDERTVYRVDADVPMHRISAPDGTYIYPDGVNFSKFDPALFNVELLVAQNLTDGETDSIPVIASVRENRRGYGTSANPAETLESVGSVSVTNSFDSVDAASASVSKAKSARAYEQLARNNDIESVVLDVKVRPALAETDNVVNATGARRRYGVSGKNVTVAVLDTGINQSHPDLRGSVIEEKDFTGRNITYDTDGHGTHVAGIIAGDGTASGGDYVGMAPNASLIDARVCNDYCSYSDMIDAMEYSVDNGADVVSVSIGGTAYASRSNDVMADAVAYAETHDVTVVIAAGNSGNDYSNPYFTVESPGIHDHAITVGASDKDGNVAHFSSRGPTPVGMYVKPDVVAPGVSVTSANSSSDGYVKKSGTSMATPVVSGTAALLLEAHPNWSSTRVKNVLSSTADPLGSYDVYTQGAGRIDAGEAIGSTVEIAPGTTDFGIVGERDVSKVISITNLGNTTETLNITATAKRVNGSTVGNVRLNRSSVSVAPNASERIELTVDGNNSFGAYSGRLSFDDGEYTAIFGFVKGYEITVDKNGVNGTSTENDSVRVLGSDGQRVTDSIQTVSGGTTSHYVFENGTYRVVSTGINERNGQPVVVTETFSVSGDTTVTVDESDTVELSLDTSATEQKHGELAVRSVELNYEILALRDTASGSVSVPSPATDSVRVTESDELDVSLEHVLAPKSDGSGDDSFDVPVVYHVFNRQWGTTGGRTFEVNPDELASRNVTYARSSRSRTYDVSMSATDWLFDTATDTATTGGIGDRRHQILYLTPDVPLYHLDAKSDSAATDTWMLDGYYPTYGSDVDLPLTLNRHPFVGAVSADFRYVPETRKTYVDVATLSQARVYHGLWDYSDDTPDTVRITQNGTVLREVNVTDARWSDSSVEIDSDSSLEVRVIGRNGAAPLSTKTVTTVNQSYRPSGDGTAPEINVNVPKLDENNTISDETVTVDVFLWESNPATVDAWLTTNDTDSTPFEGTASDDWRSASVRQVGSNEYFSRYEATIPVEDYNGTASIALRATDENGNRVEMTTFNAFRVDTKPPEIDVTALGESETPTAAPGGRTVATNKTLTVNATVDGTPGDAADVEFVLSAAFANFRTEFPATTTDGRKWTSAMNLSALPDDGNYTLVARATDSVGNENRTVANATVVLDRTSPELGATLRRVNATHGRVTVRASEPLSSAPTANVTGPNGSELPGLTKNATANGSVWEATFDASEDGRYDVSVTGADRVGNVGDATASANFSTVSTVNETVTVKLEKSGIFVRFDTDEEVNDTFVTLTESRSELAPLSSNLAGLSFLNGQLDAELTRNLTNATIGIPVEELRLPKGVEKRQVKVNYYDESVGRWEVQDTDIRTVTLADDSPKEYLLANVTHFSTYGALINDTDAPVVTAVEPTETLDSGTRNATVRFKYEDAVTGVDVGTVSLSFDGAPVAESPNATVTSEYVTYRATNLTTGTHTAELRVTDNAGNVRRETLTVEVGNSSESGGSGGGGGGGFPTASVNVAPGPNGVAIDILGGVEGQTAWADLSDLEAGGVTFERYGVEFERGASAAVTVDARTTPPTGTSELDGALGYFGVDERYVMDSAVDTARLRATVSKDALPAGATAADVRVYHYRDGEWRPVWTKRDGRTVTGIAPRVAPMAVGVESGADVSVAAATLSAEAVAPGEQVTVRATVENAGDSPGELEVALAVDGETVERKTVRVAPGKSKRVAFTRTFAEAGSYDVSVNGVSAGSVRVSRAAGTTADGGSGEDGDTRNGNGQPGFGALAALVALACIALSRRR
ncbi:S8 family serine peptidase [Haladaptatus salinisoli]|uniref:S8 family serine peptidase n=1 Tax=Haladaptatus salinisoli TaxID=2884876 RepID=UPI001D0B6086|nr:S8 family serine peptidase [Haladaptatus salinisoli]